MLQVQNCTMDKSCDLGFEYTTMKAEVNSHILSVKKPKGGSLVADSIGEIIIDKNYINPDECKITVKTEGK